MSLNIPQRIVSYNNSYGKAPGNLTCQASKISFSGKKENESKKTSPAKIALGLLITAAVVEGIIRYNPVRKNITKQYLDVFNNAGNEVRKLPTLPKRDEVIILQAANGNKAAEKFFPTIESEGKGIAAYIKSDNKYKRSVQYYAEGHFDEYTAKSAAKQKKEKDFFEKFNRNVVKRAKLYEKYIKPILPVNL